MSECIRTHFSTPEKYFRSSTIANMEDYLNDRNTLEVYISSLIYKAGFSKDIYAATYSFSSPLVAASMKRIMATSGITGKVHLIYDASSQDERAPEQAFNYLINASYDDEIQARTPNDNGIMHNKFVVVGNTVILGSYNFGLYASFIQDNDILIIKSNTLADELRLHWMKMSGNNQGGDVGSVRHIQLQDGTIISPLYGPKQDICGIINKLLTNLKDQIVEVKVAMYTFTRDDISASLIDIARSGKTVKVLLDGLQTDRLAIQSSISNDMSSNSVHVKQMNKGSGGIIHIEIPSDLSAFGRQFVEQTYILHNKYYLIKTTTKNILITGSQNATKSANILNDEIMVIIENNNEIFDAYNNRFETMWNLS